MLLIPSERRLDRRKSGHPSRGSAWRRRDDGPDPLCAIAQQERNLVLVEVHRFDAQERDELDVPPSLDEQAICAEGELGIGLTPRRQDDERGDSCDGSDEQRGDRDGPDVQRDELRDRHRQREQEHGACDGARRHLERTWPSERKPLKPLAAHRSATAPKRSTRLRALCIPEVARCFVRRGVDGCGDVMVTASLSAIPSPAKSGRSGRGTFFVLLVLSR